MTLVVKRILAQKDQYRTPSGEVLVDADFLRASEKQAEVVLLKRLVVDMNAHAPGHATPVRLVMSLRGNICTLTVPEASCVDAHDVVRALDRALETHREGESSYRAGLQVLRVLGQGEGGRRLVFSVPDAMVLADILHHAKDAGGLTMDGDFADLGQWHPPYKWRYR